MKRFFALILAIIMLCCFSAPAETESSFMDVASSTVSIINDFLSNYYGMDQLFTSRQEVVPGEIYGFFSDTEDIEILMIANSETGEADTCCIMTNTPENLRLAMNCTCMLPTTVHFINSEGDTSGAWMEEMQLIAQWFDAEYDAAYAAFQAGELYTISYPERDSFGLDLMIVPVDEGTNMLITYYFNPVAE